VPSSGKKGYFLVDPFTGDFDLPKRKCLNGFFKRLFKNVSIKISNFGDLFFALTDASRCGFEKKCSRNFANYFESSSAFKIWKNLYF
jgi:hypothetical protein